MKVLHTAYCGAIICELKEQYTENGKIDEEKWHCRDRFAKG